RRQCLPRSTNPAAQWQPSTTMGKAPIEKQEARQRFEALDRTKRRLGPTPSSAQARKPELACSNRPAVEKAAITIDHIGAGQVRRERRRAARAGDAAWRRFP